MNCEVYKKTKHLPIGNVSSPITNPSTPVNNLIQANLVYFISVWLLPEPRILIKDKEETQSELGMASSSNQFDILNYGLDDVFK